MQPCRATGSHYPPPRHRRGGDCMMELIRRPADDGAEKRRVLRARHLIGDLAARMGEAGRARQVEADLNDAWLRLQLAQVMNDPALARRQQAVCESLLDEALE